uniref:Uncharacterized protein n=1 Tax=Rhizophora mucronata TaxID=61149 RepID=A0A2P2MGC5_RHIMU
MKPRKERINALNPDTCAILNTETFTLFSQFQTPAWLLQLNNKYIFEETEIRKSKNLEFRTQPPFPKRT